MTIGAASTVIGPALAGLLIAWHGAVLVLAATFHFFASPEAETLDPRPEHNAAEPPTSGKVSVIRGNPTLMGLLTLSFGFFFLFGPVYVALPLHVATDLHGSATLLAAFYTAFGIGALLGATLTGYLNRWPLWPSTIGIVVGFGAVMLLVGLDVPTPVALVSFALAGLLWPPYASMPTALFQHSTTSRLLPQLTGRQLLRPSPLRTAGYRPGWPPRGRRRRPAQRCSSRRQRSSHSGWPRQAPWRSGLADRDAHPLVTPRTWSAVPTLAWRCAMDGSPGSASARGDNFAAGISDKFTPVHTGAVAVSIFPRFRQPLGRES